METAQGPVSRRARPAKAPLSRDVIVRTGLGILDRDGMDALTMRKVAQELDTGAASLYVYVRNREELLQLMLDEAVAGVPLPASRRGGWRKRLTTLLDAYVDALSRHDRLAFVALGHAPMGTRTLLVLEHVIALLKETDLDDHTIAWAVDLLGLYVAVTAAEKNIRLQWTERGGTRKQSVEVAEELYASLPADRYPYIVGMRTQLLQGEGAARSRWFLDVILDGILSTPAPSARRSR